jgi:hypothetical protein
MIEKKPQHPQQDQNKTKRDSFGNTKGNTKPGISSMPRSGGPKTPPPPKGSNGKQS